MTYTIRHAGGHVEVLNGEGDFLFSADSTYEAECELRDLEAAA
jgi:hypothetical protein